MLSQVAWGVGSGSIPLESAVRIAHVLLLAGADPNACCKGYRPLDMLVAGVIIKPDGASSLELFVELLTNHGLSHAKEGRYSLEAIVYMLKKYGVDDNIAGLLEKGPDALTLSIATPQTSQTRPRRTL